MKIWGIVAAVILSLFLLLPSLVPPDSKFAKYLPGKKLNLGLDLRGGIHVVLGVEVQKALDVENDKFVQDLQQQIDEKQIVGAKVDRVPGERAIKVTLRNPSQDEPLLEKVLQEHYYKTLSLSERVADGAIVKMEPDYEANIVKMSLEQAREIIRNRVDEFGVAEPVIQLQGTDRILVQLPGVQDPERAIQLIGKTALLEFKAVDYTLSGSQLDALVEKARKQVNFKNNFTRADLDKINDSLKADLPAGTIISFEKASDFRSKEVSLRPYLLKAVTLLAGSALEDARVGSDPNTQKPLVSIRFSKTGAETFEKISEANIGKQVAILLDGVVISAPVIQSKISAAGNGAVITLGGNNRQQMVKEAKDLALVLRSGALPAPVEVLENRTVGASLGEESIQKGKLAGIIGAILIMLFMVFYYRWSGALADLCLVINILMLLAVMALLQSTLTLPGIAGLVLTIGMSVDSNVIIIERIREELRTGKRVRAAIEAGFREAHHAIFDANATTLIAGLVLYNFGTGPIRGFAVTLLVGLFSNYLAAVWFSRWIYEWYLDRNPVTSLSV